MFFLNMIPLLGIIMEFVLGNSDKTFLGIDERTELGYLINFQNVIYLVVEDWLNFTLNWDSKSLLMVQFYFDGFYPCIEGFSIIYPFVKVYGFELGSK